MVDQPPTYPLMGKGPTLGYMGIDIFYHPTLPEKFSIPYTCPTLCMYASAAQVLKGLALQGRSLSSV